MTRTNLPKILATAALAAFASSSANAVVLTYKNLSCGYSSSNANIDPVFNVTITNVGKGSVPSKATYTIAYVNPDKTFTKKLSLWLKPKQSATTSSPSLAHAPASCSAVAHWYVPNEVKH
jgi:hypothetical protein